MKGVFIVLEGPDGSGTSTHAALLAARMQREGRNVLQTHEPTDGPIGRMIRTLLQNGGMPSDALQLLFTADRAWHSTEGILPALQRGDVVICDRYALSTILYGQALGLDKEWLEDMNKKFIQPARTIVLLPPLATCRARLGHRPSRDIMEGEDLQQVVYECYRAHAMESGLPIVDTSGSVESASEEIFRLTIEATGCIA